MDIADVCKSIIFLVGRPVALCCTKIRIWGGGEGGKQGGGGLCEQLLA